jgi:adenylate kinase
MRRLSLIGPPGAGKGTLADGLRRELDVPAIATGDMLRHEVEEGTNLGRRAKSFMDRGELVPDELVVELAVSRLGRPDAASGWILDGFPRNVGQARGLDEELGDASVEVVIALDIPNQEIIDRISGRRVCPQGHVYHVTRDPPQQEGVCDEDGEPLTHRDDDNEAVARHRVEIYEEQTRPVLEFYDDRGLLRRVDGDGTPEDVYKRVIAVLKR